MSATKMLVNRQVYINCCCSSILVADQFKQVHVLLLQISGGK